MTAPKASPTSALPEEEEVLTGEEGEDTKFSGDTTLFEFDADKKWRECGKVRESHCRDIHMGVSDMKTSK